MINGYTHNALLHGIRLEAVCFQKSGWKNSLNIIAPFLQTTIENAKRQSQLVQGLATWASRLYKLPLCHKDAFPANRYINIVFALLGFQKQQ
jgi:hypothetical protein